MPNIEEIEKQRGYKFTEAEKEQYEKRNKIISKTVQSSLTSLIPIVGNVLNTMELEERLYRIEKIISTLKFEENVVNLISFRNVLNKYLQDEMQLHDKIAENVIKMLGEENVNKEVLVKFNELSCYMHNKLFDLLSEYKNMADVADDSLYFDRDKINKQLTTFEINQLVNFGIFERMTGGMSYGGSSNSFDSLKLNKTFNEFVQKIYDIDVAITPVQPCNFWEHKKLINKEIAYRIRFKDTPTIYRNGDGDKYEVLIQNIKKEVTKLYENVVGLELKYREIKRLSYDDYIVLLPQSKIDKEVVNKFDEEFGLWCQQLESSLDYIYLRDKYEVDTTDSNITYI